ncbi:MAG: carboxypeptidase-like regulatory domain-containing protein [Sedimenticolaceae bacterium]|nr:carboxypeptidase-like regulatory domain-containing protein [Sedimenticolaceae bacterium]
MKSEIAQASPESSATKQPLEPVGDLAISGRVLDRSGSPVEGITVIARAYHLFDPDSGRSVPARDYQRETTSGYNGAYAFERLVDGEYRLSTVATEIHPPVQILVRAGVDFADLILTGQLELRVYGVVTTADGEPLAGVSISPVVHEAPVVLSGKDGRYDLRVELRDIVTSLTLRVSKAGFENQQLGLKFSPTDAKELELDIVMQTGEQAGLADVRGVVRGPDGEAVSNQRVNLSSANERKSYQAVTDLQGRFEMGGVLPGDDYMLSINAQSVYQDYFQRNIKILPSGVTLNIELETQDTGTLSGRMVNLFGIPVANFSMVLKTKETSFYNQRVVGDGSGSFEVENAPAGELLLRTESTPYYTVAGIRLPAGGSLNIPVVLDWGYDEIRGKVVDQDGYPVAVPNINLGWSHQQDGLVSTSRRTTAADEEGIFHFTQLGPGVHRLTISVGGYKPVTVNHDVALQGSLLEVELIPEE